MKSDPGAVTEAEELVATAAAVDTAGMARAEADEAAANEDEVPLNAEEAEDSDMLDPEAVDVVDTEYCDAPIDVDTVSVLVATARDAFEKSWRSLFHCAATAELPAPAGNGAGSKAFAGTRACVTAASAADEAASPCWLLVE